MLLRLLRDPDSFLDCLTLIFLLNIKFFAAVEVI